MIKLHNVEFVRYLQNQMVLESYHKIKDSKIYTQVISLDERHDRKILLNHRNFARSRNFFAESTPMMKSTL